MELNHTNIDINKLHGCTTATRYIFKEEEDHCPESRCADEPAGKTHSNCQPDDGDCRWENKVGRCHSSSRVVRSEELTVSFYRHIHGFK